MLKDEIITIKERQFIKHFSDENKYIRQVETGVLYGEAVDTIPCRYTYTETDETIERSIQNEEMQEIEQ